MRFRLLIVVLLMALVPLRAIGALTISVCASDASVPAAVEHDGCAEHGNDGAEDAAPASEGGHVCSYCAAHCAGVAFLASAQAPLGAAAGTFHPVPPGSPAVTAVVLDRLDRPPLAS
mgnify:CR=1 FL=1